MEAAGEYIVESTELILELYYSHIDVDKAVELLEDEDISAELVKTIYNELSKKVEKLMTDRFHYYTIRADNYSRIGLNAWTRRYLLVYEKELLNSDFHEITVFDVFNDKSIKLTVEKSTEKLIEIYPLKDGFGLLNEEGDRNYSISLIFLDLYQHTLKKLHTVEYNTHDIEIIVNKADPTKFILSVGSYLDVYICKIVENRIIIGDRIEIDVCMNCFYGDNVYALDSYDSDEHLEKYRISIYNLEQKTGNGFDLELPENYTMYSFKYAWIRDNLLLGLECGNKTGVIGYFTVQTRQLDILDFFLKLPIYIIAAFDQGNFIICTKKDNSNKNQVYKIPFGNPDSLENMSWFSFIKAMKKDEIVDDPYETARKYLPPNSSINCPFDRLDECEPKKKRSKLE